LVCEQRRGAANIKQPSEGSHKGVGISYAIDGLLTSASGLLQVFPPNVLRRSETIDSPPPMGATTLAVSLAGRVTDDIYSSYPSPDNTNTGLSIRCIG